MMVVTPKQFQFGSLNGAIYTSSNGGASWSPVSNTSGPLWADAAMSADGLYQTAVAAGGRFVYFK